MCICTCEFISYCVYSLYLRACIWRPEAALDVCLYLSYLSLKAKSLTVSEGHQSTQQIDQLSPGSLYISHSRVVVLGPEEVPVLMFP